MTGTCVLNNVSSEDAKIQGTYEAGNRFYCRLH